MNQLSEVATSLIEYCGADGRVCPRGDKWQELWKMLPEDLTKVGREKIPLPPLILAAIECQPWEKRMRVKDHIAWADARGVIGQVNSFLRGLSFEEWERSTSNCIEDNFYDHFSFKSCIVNDDVDGMKMYLSKGVDPKDDYAEYSNGDALACAVEAEAINAVAYLLTIGVELDCVSACAIAASRRIDILELLLDAGVVPDADALCSAMNVQVAERLLRAGAPINELASFGWHALHNATVEDQTEIVELLLRSGANPNVTTQDGTTPLMFAVCGGNVAIVELLLKYGADPLRRNELGETALDQARENHQQTAVTILESLVSK
ncbi:MAG: ankyrin repeat domain-containing protein [Methylococcales bacterium]|nr:ankyrin repeat domain-containing protein [Methylococcales bacterium]MDD5631917.1 ankyrin repeat domain-containing protein [Methylococcales bacterium]